MEGQRKWTLGTTYRKGETVEGAGLRVGVWRVVVLDNLIDVEYTLVIRV